MRRSKSASITKSSNDFNNTTLTTSSTTRSGKFGSTTISRYNKEVYSRTTGAKVGSTSSIKKDVSFNANFGIVNSVFGILFSILLLVNLFGLLSGTSEYRGLEWLLNILSNAPQIDITWLQQWGAASINTSDWGLFAPIGTLLNDLSTILNLISFLVVGVINILTFVLYFVGSFLYIGI